VTKFPAGLDHIRQTYGDPSIHILDDGGVDPKWEALTLGMLYIPAPMKLGWNHDIKVKRLRMHWKVLTEIDRVLREILNNGNWEDIKTFDGTYTWRAKRGQQKLSTHSWGIAIDLNAATNGLGSKGDMPDTIVRPFVDAGWEWGGYWDYPDPMHFQACHRY